MIDVYGILELIAFVVLILPNVSRETLESEEKNGI